MSEAARIAYLVGVRVGNDLGPRSRLSLMKQVTEVREHLRVETCERCWVETDSVTLYARLVNISAGGAFVRTATPIPKGTAARVRWSLGEGSAEIETEAVVAWVRPIASGDEDPAGMGLCFSTLATEDRGLIDAFVAEQLAA